MILPPPPYTTWRPGQSEVVETILNSPAKYVVLEIPPGGGKSVIAVGVGRNRPTRGGSAANHYLTATKALQTQYEGIDGVVGVRGRGNFPCLIEPKVTADVGVCTMGRKCQYAGKSGTEGCEYEDQKREALEAGDVVFNYAYWLTTMNSFNPPFPVPGLLVCDEAHTLRQEVERFVGVTVRTRTLDRLDIEPPAGTTVGSWRRWAKANVAKVHAAIKATNRDSQRYQWHQYSALYKAMDRCAETDDASFVIEELPLGTGWEFKPVWASGWARSAVFRHVPQDGKVVLMSATILDKEVFCESVGIPADQAEFVRLGSTFPRESRPLRYWPVAKVSGRLGAATLGQIGDAVDEILAAHGGEKGLVHTTNYTIAQYLVEHSRYPGRLLTHTAKNREDVLRTFRSSPHPVVLVSPSMTTGVDLPYEQTRFQIITKLPFPDISSPQRRAQMGKELGQELVTYDTAATLIQTYGRAMRAEDDWGVTYLLDSNFNWFRHKATRYLPEWFTEAIEWDVRLGSLERKVLA